MAVDPGRPSQARLARAGLHCRGGSAVRRDRRPGDPTQHHRPVLSLLHLLGPRYKVIASDVTEGGPGNGERLAYIYDSERVQPSGLVGELVLPAGTSGDVDQFARTPYAAGFVREATEFILTTVHVLWGKKPADRIGELSAFAAWMRGWADQPNDWNRNLLVLGDFKLDRIDDPPLRRVPLHRAVASGRAQRRAAHDL